MTAPDHDDQIREHVVARVRERFPEAGETTVRGAVDGGFDAFAHARVTDFVPILAERSAVRELRARIR